MTDLNPCPKCGGQAELIHNVLWDEDDPPEDDAESYLVRCHKCYKRTWACDTPEEAIEQWNRRVGS